MFLFLLACSRPSEPPAILDQWWALEKNHINVYVASDHRMWYDLINGPADILEENPYFGTWEWLDNYSGLWLQMYGTNQEYRVSLTPEGDCWRIRHGFYSDLGCPL